jgi:hypothetical protein
MVSGDVPVQRADDSDGDFGRGRGRLRNDSQGGELPAAQSPQTTGTPRRPTKVGRR